MKKRLNAVDGTRPEFVVGERVVVSYGSLSNVEGVVKSLRGKDRLILSVRLLQRSISVEIDSAWVASCPPVDAEYLLYLFLDKKYTEAVVGDLEERWRKLRKKFGVRRANFWYWTQVIRSLGSFGWVALKRLSGLLALLEMWRRVKG